MTSLSINTQATNANVILSMPALSSFGEKTFAKESYISYSAAPKSWSRKSVSRLSSIDWDLNMNELEFE